VSVRESIEIDGSRWGVLVHGGAGHVPIDRRPRHVEGCARAAKIGAEVIARGGSSLDAVEAAVRALEDDPSFNAGTGACLNAEGQVEHDASIMSGDDLRAGAVCALASFKNPIAIARAALEDGRHVLYAAHGARAFALAHGFEEVDPTSLVTEAARAAWDAARKSDDAAGWAGGTVGAVARDVRGHLAAATSTGGTMNKRAGRVGDSPLVGAGCFADDEAGAVSTTGHGEGMMRLVIAKSIADDVRRGASPSEAVGAALAILERRVGAHGGAIAVSPRGDFGLGRTTATMSWAWSGEHGEKSGI
jgi:beta-aspartyl-peptidase (threonine type)